VDQFEQTFTSKMLQLLSVLADVHINKTYDASKLPILLGSLGRHFGEQRALGIVKTRQGFLS
jgi:hypothetical protein